jgi:selenocysteine-specific elongation factor
MKHLIVGTAGHVDHGKTALIRALTGTDTDRLREEKVRGISIDIGFAALHYPDTLTLGIVDVPGHERFLKNMLAGTGAIDMVMLVVAADEGIMPQTREHFEMLRCLGIKAGLVVISKTDKVEPDWLELVEEEIRGYLDQSFLSEAPICRVSSLSGEGVDHLKQTLLQVALAVSPRNQAAPFRLWIDRAFNLKGQGLIVTGSVMNGSVSNGAGLALYPGNIPVKVRELESHNQELETVSAGQRASLKLAGAVLADVGRGMFLSEEGYCHISAVWEAAIQWKEKFPSGTRIRLHLGTGEFIGRLSFRKPSETDPTPKVVRLHLEQEIAAAFGDQGLLRRFSPQDLIGGVTLLVPADIGSRRQELLLQLEQAHRNQNVENVMLVLLNLFKNPPNLKEWRQAAGYIETEVVQKAIKRLLEQGKVKLAGNYYISDQLLTILKLNLKKILADYHQFKPAEPGISKETLRQKVKIAANIADWFLNVCVEQGLCVVQGEYVANSVHAKKHGGNTEELIILLDSVVPENELIDLTPQWLAEKMGRPIEQIKPFFERMVREKVIIRLSGVHVYRKTMQYIRAIIQRHFSENETMSVGEIRDLLKTSRRVAIPLMEYLDANNYTVREGDRRRAGAALTNLSE